MVMPGFHHYVRILQRNAIRRTASVFRSTIVAEKVGNATACGSGILAELQVRKYRRRAGGIAVQCAALRRVTERNSTQVYLKNTIEILIRMRNVMIKTMR